MTTESHINQLFDNLDQWRHLPAYQLERRADIFFSLYLAEVLASKAEFGFTKQPTLIPEFPIFYGSLRTLKNNTQLYGNSSDNQSFKIDYLAISKDRNNAVFVELKTEDKSSKVEQIENMGDAAALGMNVSVAAVLAKRENASPKYITLRDSLNGEFSATSKTRIAYILPNPPAGKIKAAIERQADIATVITFADFADVVEKHPDYISARFANSLRKWACTKVGELTQ
jgi:hypothetical protein